MTRIKQPVCGNYTVTVCVSVPAVSVKDARRATLRALGGISAGGEVNWIEVVPCDCEEAK